MSYNETIYSGTSAHSARQIADELHGREWPLADSNFRDLAGAVTTLARAVALQRVEIAKQAASLVAVAREVERIRPVVVDHDSGPSTNGPPPGWFEQSQKEAAAFNAAHPNSWRPDAPLPPLPAPAEQLAMVYEGLREVRAMIHTGLAMLTGSSPETAQARGGLLQAIDLRLGAMLEAGEPDKGG